MTSTDYSIQDLSDLTGLPRRTIHFYLQQRLLPSPEGAGPGARYGEEHLLRLKLIPLLRRQGLRLDEIRARFEHLDQPDLQALFQQANLPPAPPPEFLPVSQAYAHYQLPAGMFLAAPAALTKQEREKLNQLLKTAHDLFTNTL